MADTPRRETSPTTARKRSRRAKAKAPKLSRLHKPADMPLRTWQRQLRRQFGREQSFQLKRLGDHPIFSRFQVTNPKSGNTYEVAIRGAQIGDNYCSCPDFATNTLGTCKHIEFTLARLERRRGGLRALREGFQPSFSEVFLQYGARREVRFRRGTECPVELARLAARFFDDEGTLLPDAFATFDVFLAKTAEIDHPLNCYEDVLDFVAEVRDAQQRRERLAKTYRRGIGSAALKNLLSVPLYDYQREGALFAARAGRCLIGDEMGLGKTIQAIAATEIMAGQFGVERVLIICPTSLKHQWEREIERFADRSVQVIGGLRAKRAEQFRSDSFYKVTNYDTVHRDLEDITAWSPDLVILDEAQRIKNWSTRAATSVKKISSPYAIVLTGTPLENRLEELVSIVQFIDRHRLGPTFQFLHDHQVREETGRVVGYRDLDRIGKTLEPILIRRQKDQVLDQLPERLDKNFFVPMTPEQMQHHEENREIVARIVQKWRRYKFLSEADQRRLTCALQNMRMSCNSTYLLDQTTDFGVKADEAVTLLEENFERAGTKVVVFSQWLRTHELLIRRFETRGWDHVFFHGGVPSPARKKLVDRFRQDESCRVFLATDAGGVGLNLQHASAVINLDLPWNPAVLEQRIGRVHRLGQTQPVRVTNFVAQGTIEEGMLSLLSFKKSLFAGVLDGGDKEVFLGGTRLNRFMETVEKATTTIPEATIEAAAPEPEETAAQTRPSGEPSAAAPAAGADPLAGLLQTGLAFLQQLGAAAQGSAGGQKPGKLAGSESGPVQVVRDEKTGQAHVKIALPEPEVIDQALKAIGQWVQSLR